MLGDHKLYVPNGCPNLAATHQLVANTLARKVDQEGGEEHDDQVQDGEFVQLLPHVGLPAPGPGTLTVTKINKATWIMANNGQQLKETLYKFRYGYKTI